MVCVTSTIPYLYGCHFLHTILLFLSTGRYATTRPFNSVFVVIFWFYMAKWIPLDSSLVLMLDNLMAIFPKCENLPKKNRGNNGVPETCEFYFNVLHHILSCNKRDGWRNYRENIGVLTLTKKSKTFFRSTYFSSTQLILKCSLLIPFHVLPFLKSNVSFQKAKEHYLIFFPGVRNGTYHLSSW